MAGRELRTEPPSGRVSPRNFVHGPHGWSDHQPQRSVAGPLDAGHSRSHGSGPGINEPLPIPERAAPIHARYRRRRAGAESRIRTLPTNPRRSFSRAAGPRQCVNDAPLVEVFRPRLLVFRSRWLAAGESRGCLSLALPTGEKRAPDVDFSGTHGRDRTWGVAYLES